MSQSLFFYDLETSGVNPRAARIMQFAGQRTNLDLEPLGKPINILIKLTPDVVPEPEAIFITGITPQQTLQEGITEAEFSQIFCKEIATPGTIFAGYNIVRFDDEFVRFLLYRNFYDPYEWQWKDSCSRWDLLDVVRMTRALRPNGIKWPINEDNKPTNRLELLTALNGLDHQHARDALSDVQASIALARLLKNKQPKLYEFLFAIRDKKKAAELVFKKQPFIYTSGKYSAEFEKTTVVTAIAKHPKKQGALVYDLRHDPLPYRDYTPGQLAEAWKFQPDTPRLPVKTLQFNRCPAIAPLGVLDKSSQARLQLNLMQIETNRNALASMKGWPEKIVHAIDILDTEQQARHIQKTSHVDQQLYDSFIPDSDKITARTLRSSDPHAITQIGLQFRDQRLRELAPLYKARNYPDLLDQDERANWEKYVGNALLGGGEASPLATYFQRLGELAKKSDLTATEQYLLEELQLYGQSIVPVYDES